MGHSHSGNILYDPFFCCGHSINTISAQELVSRFSATDPKVNVGVLEVAHSIFVRWRPLFRTDELYMEINHVISTFGQAFVQLLVVSRGQSTCPLQLR